MKDNIDRTSAGAPKLTRRQVLRTIAYAGGGALLSACNASINIGNRPGDENGQGQNPTDTGQKDQRPAAATAGAVATEAPRLTPVPDYNAINEAVIDQIRLAEVGSIIEIPELVIQGFRRDTPSVAFTPIRATTVTALSGRLVGEDQTRRTGFIQAAGCLWDRAKAQGLLEGVTPSTEGSHFDWPIEHWQLPLEKTIVLKEVRVKVDVPIPGEEGGKVLELQEYKEGNTIVQCGMSSKGETAAAFAVKQKYLFEQESLNKPTPTQTPSPS